MQTTKSYITTSKEHVKLHAIHAVVGLSLSSWLEHKEGYDIISDSGVCE